MSIPVPEKRIADFEKLGYGMFIHWGIYSQLEMGEKILWFSKTPKDEYKSLMTTFTADRFDAREIARFAKSCGMNYITLTARHHDGFSLFDTRGLNDYDAPHAACGRDLVGEFVEGCRMEGVVPFLYHTTLDWMNPDFDADFPAYVEYLRASVELLCKNYGKIGGLWFDGNWSKPDEDWQEDALYGMIRRYQPDAMIINNTGVSKRGALGHPELDSVTFENGKPGKINREGWPKYLAAEMCQTMNTRWGIGRLDFSYKAPADLIETLCLCRRWGANYLLNVSPDGHGEIPLIQKGFLDNTGRWIKTAAPEVIYRGRPADIESGERDFALTMDNDLYLFVHSLPTNWDPHIIVDGAFSGGRLFTGVTKRVRRVTWTDNGEELRFIQDGERLTVDCTGYPYAQNLVVRVAKVETED